MTIAEKNVDQVNKYLSQKFRSGDKWVVWDDSNKHINSINTRDLLAFRKIDAAYNYCDENMGGDQCYRDSEYTLENKFYHYKFMPIINALKSLTGAISVSQVKIDAGKLEEQLKQLPIEGYHNDKPLVNVLSDGLYHPVMLKQQILPWTDIENFTVIEHEYPRGMIYEMGHSSLRHKDFPSYYEAQKLFDELVAQNGSSQMHHPEIKLIGKIKGQKLGLDFEDFPHPGTGVLFKIANYFGKIDGEDAYEVKRLNAPDKPMDIQQQKMARFNWHNSTLEFFDGALEKVAHNARVDFMNFGHLSTSPVKVTNTLQQSVTQYDKLLKEDVKIKGLRFKPGF